uniref:Uncharacterized protein n=1 Tax=Micrurus surinamensis TaxID=129470 RepID=A0A2D4PI23_MICSU
MVREQYLSTLNKLKSSGPDGLYQWWLTFLGSCAKNCTYACMHALASTQNAMHAPPPHTPCAFACNPPATLLPSLCFTADFLPGLRPFSTSQRLGKSPCKAPQDKP